MEKKFGLIGSTVSHSFSKSYFDEKFFREGLRDYHYDLYSLPTIDDLKKLLDENPELAGLNVTIPYKEQVIKFLSDIDNDAKKIGAVNVIKIQNGKLKGYNTDAAAFYESLEKWYPRSEKSRALILGTGGSSKAVQQALINLNIPFELVSRDAKSGQHTYESLKKDGSPISNANLIINTSPLGMSPNTNAYPAIDYDLLTSDHYVYDLIYNPARTMFLQRAEMRNAHFKNGLEMLHIQAEKSWNIWNN
ncbi:MAG TPA: shikimate dehydrogenase [Cyclobacteriaceae bacterium]|jgi:shikimate dehydrogenase|nr:shikimate dehydrogenase [Cytophagales bacterium]HRE68404.1 shikimate dehydrogenase [Cyclobacteriaceae bacterium]HRF31851.1 shikimate dehydrogenase [Cyclobacteriaceae bacterium]